MMAKPDLIIIGAGPAGMAAAATAANGGLKVHLLDDQPAAGGQVYRNITRNQDRLTHLGPEYTKGIPLADALDHPNITHVAGAAVWRIDDTPTVWYSLHGKSHAIHADHVLIATGAQERPVPFAGWTLPGVMPAGAAQILMKSSDLLPKDAVLAGSGPLLYLIAVQMIEAGQPPVAMVETQTPQMMMRAVRHLPRALLDRQQIFKGLAMLRKIRAARIPRYTAAHSFKAQIQGDLLDFEFTSKGATRHLKCALVLSHQGIIPATHLTRSAGIPHKWHKAQQCWHPEHDTEGRTARPGLWVAGDSAGILGADAARAQGVITANAIICAVRGLRPSIASHVNAHAINHRNRAQTIRAFLDAAYAVPPEINTPPDDTILCRCEEITAGTIRQAIHDGATELRHLKTATRIGMGPCQGRQCDLSLTHMLAAQTQRPIATVGMPRARSPVRPVSLGEIAALEQTD